MYILMITRGTPTPNDPQSGSFEFDQAKALSSLGHKVVVMTVDGRFRWYYRKKGITKTIKDGIACYNSYILPGNVVKLFGTKLYDYHYEKQWTKLYHLILEEQGKPDVIYVHYLFCTYRTFRYLPEIDVPVVGIEHWSELKKEPLPLKVKTMAESAYHKVDSLLSVSESLRKTIYDKFNVDSTVVYNMVGNEFFYREKPKTVNQKVRFVAAGSLIHRKGYDLLIKAFAKISNQLDDKNWELLIIGNGAERKNLQTLIESCGLSENIKLLGSKNKTQIADIYMNSDVFVLPSRSETFGVVYIEALACGLPVIATPCGGPEEFIRDKDGILVPIDNTDELADALLFMYKNYKNYSRAEIAADCKARFATDVIAKQLTQIFQSVLDRKTE